MVLIGGAFAVRGWFGRAPGAGVGVSDAVDTAEATAPASESRAPSANAVQLSSGAPYGGTAPSVPSAPPLAPSASWAGEAALMARLRLIEDRDPAVALALAREGNALYPNSSESAERAMVVVKSLARQGELAEARGEAERMVNLYPGTRWAREVEQQTGAHPHAPASR